MNYHVARNGQQLGVLTDSDIIQKIASGELGRNDLVWTEGMDQWQPISNVIALGSEGMPPSLAASQPPHAGPPSTVFTTNSGKSGLASLGERLGAALLDGAVAIPAAILIGIGLINTNQATGDPSPFGLLMIVLGGLYMLGLIIYNLVRLSTHGQTIGKKWLGIRIARIEDGSNAGFVKAVLLRGFVNGLIGAIPFIGGFYSLVDICFIFREDRRCIHDLIAGTHVVKC